MIITRQLLSNKLLLLSVLLIINLDNVVAINNNNNSNQGNNNQQNENDRNHNNKNDASIPSSLFMNTDDVELIKDFDKELTITDSDNNNNQKSNNENRFHNTNGLIVLIAQPFKSQQRSIADKSMIMPIVIKASNDNQNKQIEWNVVNLSQQSQHKLKQHFNNLNNIIHNNHQNHRQPHKHPKQSNQQHQRSTRNRIMNNELLPATPQHQQRARFWSPQQAKLAKFKFLNFRKRFFPL